MQKLVNKIINESVKDADIYQSNGSTWIIFTDNKQWVIELTENKTLWYNYNFFKNLFNYLSLDVVENQHYITKWVEDNIIGEVNDTHWGSTLNQLFVDNTIQNGVKETITSENRSRLTAENIIECGVTENSLTFAKKQMDCENTIENGVKETELHKGVRPSAVESTIQNGVKETKYNQTLQGIKFKEVLKNGVKETKTPGKDGNLLSTIEWMEENKSKSVPKMINDVIENCVKETRVCNYEDPKTGVIFVKWDVEIRNVIETGIKEVQPLPSQEGNKDWGIYYHGKEDRTKPHTEYVDEAIKTGIKYE